MVEKLYFQWQNEILCETIYPMRVAKLRDFLVYFYEIDIWQDYKSLDISGLQDEVQTCIDARSTALRTAFNAYSDLRAYFLTPDASSQYSAFLPTDEEELAQINQLHSSFITYLPRYKSIRSEANLASSQMTNWKEHCRMTRQRITQKQRRLQNMLPDHPRRAGETEQLDQMQNVTLVMAEAELDRLRAFSAAINGIKERRIAFAKQQNEVQARRKKITQRLSILKPKLPPLEKKQQELMAALQRLQAPPDLDAVQAYFSNPDASSTVRGLAPRTEQPLIDQVNELHKALMDQFGYSANPAVRLNTIKNHIHNWEWELKKLEKEAKKLETDLRNMPADWKKRPERESRLKQIREVDAVIMAAEVERINDFRAAFESSIKSKAQIEADIHATETELSKAQRSFVELEKETDELQAEVRTIDEQAEGALKRTMTTYVPDKEITTKDLAIWKSEAYRQSLESKDQTALLEDIAKRFWAQPERYPLWLQYMVVHFSGMRYASAHGSWADPRDLLMRLRAPEIEAEINVLDDETVQKLCTEKIEVYEDNDPATGPLLANAEEKEWIRKVGWNLPNLKSRGRKTRRRGLTEISKDEAAYELHLKPGQEVLDMLLAIKDQFPPWAWKQIVRLTPLRVTEVSKPGWESLTPEEEQESYAYKNSTMRSIINAWKKEHITTWREEHRRRHELIVARAVCNETAEHCQHLRGHRPPGGLTTKANWYLKHETKNRLPGTRRPYFTRPEKMEDFTEGASILWLRFVNKKPSPWQVAKTVATKDGVGMLPEDMGSAGWSYEAGDTVSRKRDGQTQWLRWIHEATVAEVGETAEGTMILTYETALPEDDRGSSAVGIFMKPLWWFLSDGSEDAYNRSFVGYVPEREIPEKNLALMLDWEKILRRRVKRAEAAKYRKVYPVKR